MLFRLVASTVLVVLCACQRDAPTTVIPRLSGDTIRFEGKIPKGEGELQAFELTDARPNPKFLAHLPPELLQRLSASETDFEFHPSFAQTAKLEPINLSEAPALVEKTLLKMRDALPNEDERTMVPDEARVLYVARAQRGKTEEQDQYEQGKPVLLYVSLRRRASSLHIDGAGSRFTVAVSADGAIRGATFYWKAQTKQIARLLSLQVPENVEAAIRKQLLLTQPHGDVIVTKVELAYYDADQRFLQPVYRYVAELAPASNVSRGRTSLLVGYVPLASGENAEQKAMLAEVPTVLTTLPVDEKHKAQHYRAVPQRFDTSVPSRTAQKISVGRYITDDEHTGWQRDAQEFWQPLESAGGPHSFDSTQHFFSRRFMLTSRKDHFVNSVDIALFEGHGSPLTVMNHRDFGGDMRFNADVPLPGYGADGGGRLKHLIVHSCRVIPAAIDKYYKDDFHNWANDWWDLFNGLSSVVGYRSSMYIDDGAGAAMGRNLARGEAVVPAWFGAVTSLNIYEQDSWAMTHCAAPELLGRASAIAVCDQGTAATVADASDPRPKCLEAWWLSDQLIPVGKSTTPMEPKPKPEQCPDEGDQEGPFPNKSG